VPNKVTIEAKRAATELVDDPEYRKNLLERLRKGKVAPAVETMLWSYAHGKPKDAVEHDGEVEFVFRWLEPGELPPGPPPPADDAA
jgi:hypothetical protein